MINGKKVVSIILARKGSKGLPGKNFKRLLNEPLFMWSVLSSLDSKYVDDVIVSSNCEEVYKRLEWFVRPRIEKRVHNSISKIPFYIKRPDEISGDLSKNEDALIHAINYLKDNKNREYDIVVNPQVTSPCRLDNLIDNCIEEYGNGGYNSLLTATKDTPFIWQKKDGKWVYNVDKNNCCNRKMRQEFDENEFLYHDNGNLYITDKKVLLDTKCRIGDNPCVFETKGINSLQIDEEFDFQVIENMAKAMNLKSLI